MDTDPVILRHEWTGADDVLYVIIVILVILAIIYIAQRIR